MNEKGLERWELPPCTYSVMREGDGHLIRGMTPLFVFILDHSSTLLQMK